MTACRCSGPAADTAESDVPAESAEDRESPDADDDAAMSDDGRPDVGPDVAPDDASADEGASDLGCNLDGLGVPPGCDYWESCTDCDGPESPRPPMPHRDCGPNARELYREDIISFSVSEHTRLSVVGNRMYVPEAFHFYAVDLETGEERVLQADARHNGGVAAAQFGDSALVVQMTAAWGDACPLRNEYILFDWESGGSRLVFADYIDIHLPSTAKLVADFDAYGNTAVVASNDENALLGLYTLDLVTGVWCRRAILFSPPAWVALWGDRVAWSVGNVRVMDLRTGERVHVGDSPQTQREVDIWEDHVVWWEYAEGDVRIGIYHHDLSTGETRRVNGTRSGALGNPRIHAGRIVFHGRDESGTPGTRIWMADVAGSEERQLTSLPGHQYIMDLWENRLYFLHYPDDGEVHGTLCEMTIPE